MTCKANSTTADELSTSPNIKRNRQSLSTKHSKKKHAKHRNMDTQKRSQRHRRIITTNNNKINNVYSIIIVGAKVTAEIVFTAKDKENLEIIAAEMPKISAVLKDLPKIIAYMESLKETIEILSDKEAMENLEESKKDLKEGRTYTWKEALKELNINEKTFNLIFLKKALKQLNQIDNSIKLRVTQEIQFLPTDPRALVNH